MDPSILAAIQDSGDNLKTQYVGQLLQPAHLRQKHHDDSEELQIIFLDFSTVRYYFAYWLACFAGGLLLSNRQVVRYCERLAPAV
jgi:hypothetical protein